MLKDLNETISDENLEQKLLLSFNAETTKNMNLLLNLSPKLNKSEKERLSNKEQYSTRDCLLFDNLHLKYDKKSLTYLLTYHL